MKKKIVCVALLVASLSLGGCMTNKQANALAGGGAGAGVGYLLGGGTGAAVGGLGGAILGGVLTEDPPREVHHYYHGGKRGKHRH